MQLAWEYNSDTSFPRKTLATKVPPGRSTCVTMVRAARISWACTNSSMSCSPVTANGRTDPSVPPQAATSQQLRTSLQQRTTLVMQQKSASADSHDPLCASRHVGLQADTGMSKCHMLRLPHPGLSVSRLQRLGRGVLPSGAPSDTTRSAFSP